MREYRTINVKNKLPSHQADKTNSNLLEIWNTLKPKPSQCLKFDDYLIIKNDKAEADSIVSVKTPDNDYFFFLF